MVSVLTLVTVVSVLIGRSWLLALGTLFPELLSLELPLEFLFDLFGALGPLGALGALGLLVQLPAKIGGRLVLFLQEILVNRQFAPALLVVLLSIAMMTPRMVPLQAMRVRLLLILSIAKAQALVRPKASVLNAMSLLVVPSVADTIPLLWSPSLKSNRFVPSLVFPSIPVVFSPRAMGVVLQLPANAIELLFAGPFLVLVSLRPMASPLPLVLVIAASMWHAVSLQAILFVALTILCSLQLRALGAAQAIGLSVIALLVVPSFAVVTSLSLLVPTLISRNLNLFLVRLWFPSPPPIPTRLAMESGAGPMLQAPANLNVFPFLGAFLVGRILVMSAFVPALLIIPIAKASAVAVLPIMLLIELDLSIWQVNAPACRLLLLTLMLLRLSGRSNAIRFSLMPLVVLPAVLAIAPLEVLIGMGVLLSGATPKAHPFVTLVRARLSLVRWSVSAPAFVRLIAVLPALQLPINDSALLEFLGQIMVILSLFPLPLAIPIATLKSEVAVAMFVDSRLALLLDMAQGTI